MKKIILAFISVFFCVFLLSSLKADEDSNFVDLYVILKQIDHINRTLDTYKDNPQKAKVYNEQKINLMRELTAKITDSKEKIGIDISQNKQKQEKVKLDIEKNAHISDNYSLLLNKISLDMLILDEQMYNVLEKLRKNLGFLSQKEDIINIISPYLMSLDEKLNTKFLIPNELSESQKQILQNQLDEYRAKLETYTEILTYFQDHAQNILPKNEIMNIGMEKILQKIDDYIPLNTHNFIFAKIVLSLFTLIVLLACRKIVARIVLRIVDFFVKFTRHNEEIQNKIRNDITKPISWFLLFWSIDISLDILYYPNIVSPRVQVWFGVIYIVLFAWFIISLLKGYGGAFISSIAQKSSDGFRKEVINLILKIIYFIVVVFALLAILKHLGFNISTIVASLGIGGLAVALAVKDMLANFFASVMLLFDNSFSQGDWIVCGDIEGTVVEMGLRRTTVRTFDNALLFVPNSELANKAIRNWNRRKVGRRMKMNIGLTYDSPREKLERCVVQIRELLTHSPYISKSDDERGAIEYQAAFKKDIVSMDDYLGYKSTLMVFIDEFAPSSINILIYCFTKTVAWAEFLQVKEEIMLEIMKIVESNDLSFAFPSQSLYVESLPSTMKNLS
ncbi:mechanosensitive ion channel domain-containing protein [Helicobacter cappadocius]|uniref:Mechanosensitive ion channel n=1 Tax=Helicobacter cappadocius TaxID=3063998 RepID=A0AA90Q165_9HELI|nr:MULTISPECIES: mechanosensitive ion channel domain-containing protein [unclassified Helicobacter]MDO7252376.1 mechanosensitive ion channel [Helicobacter sp. faydin-H75]MDP2538243.1 mechanosensitive ion channel [Helicobacter sp. faydin-H76]